MQLDVLRLRDSDLAAIVDAEVFRAAILSWCVAWHQVPAASLPDDDAALCRLLGYGRDLKGWQKVRAGGALRGYVKCSDGRLYHRVVAEKANDAWQKKRAQRDRTEAARLARLLQNKSPPVTDHMTASNRPDNSMSQTQKDSVTHNVTGSKGEGEGEGEEKVPSLRSGKRATRLPSDWQPDLEDRQFAREMGFNPDDVAARFRDYWHAKAGQPGTKLDWSATWRNWCRSDYQRGPLNGVAAQPRGDPKAGRRAFFAQGFTAQEPFDLDLTAEPPP